MREIGGEYRDLCANLRIAKKNRWSRGGLIKAVASAKKRIQYYQKIRKAVSLGYLIIPNFPIEVIAVRVDRHSPRWKYGTWPSQVNEAKPDILPADTGRYVDEMLAVRDLTHEVSDGKGGSRTVHQARSDQYIEEVDFPVVMVKPQILEATSTAMQHFLFDRIGIAHHGGGTVSRARRTSDPIVCGQILDPTRKVGYKDPWLVTFFIAWWLDTRSL
jgi:hypothetical protein